MKINSVWHFVDSGRVLRINSTSSIPGKKNAVVFTCQINLNNVITENVRIASREVAHIMRLRKYLVLSPGTSVVSGPFNIKPVDMIKDGTKTNIVINEQYYFLSFIPEIKKTLSRDMTVLIPASKPYFNKDSLDKILDFLKESSARSVILSGDYSDMWFPEIKEICRCVVSNEVSQTKLF